MMFKNYAIILLPVAFSLASACWTGEIHSPCGGSTTGCTPDGIMVECQYPPDGSMIWKDSCNTDGLGQGTCSYDADCNASC